MDLANMDLKTLSVILIRDTIEFFFFSERNDEIWLEENLDFTGKLNRNMLKKKMYTPN